MFIHPKGGSKTVVSNLDDECIQPNAVDLRVDGVFEIDNSIIPSILKDKTRHSAFYPLQLIDREVGNKTYKGFMIPANSFCQFETIHNVEIAEGEVGWLVGRSSLNRNGLFVSSGVYDAGFRGIVGGVFHNRTRRSIFIEREARVAQLILAQSESVSVYDGQYNDTGVVNVVEK